MSVLKGPNIQGTPVEDIVLKHYMGGMVGTGKLYKKEIEDCSKEVLLLKTN